MNAYWQLAVFFFAAINPASAALAMARRADDRDARSRWPGPAIGIGIAGILYAVVAFGAERILDGLDIEPESFRVAAGTVMAAAGVFIIWRGAPEYEAEASGAQASVFPLAIPLLISPAGLVAAISFGADEGGGQAFGALAVSLALAAVLLVARPERARPALDAVSRLTGALLVVVAAGLVVDGVRAI